MRFLSAQDYDLFLSLNRELINTFIDVTIVVYKLNIYESKKNVYGESTTKRWYQGVQIPCLISRQLNTSVKDTQTVNIEQIAEFNFLRVECEQRNIYPEIGDIIEFNGNYFEIDTTNEVQLIAGQVIYSHSIVVSSHLTRITGTQLEPPVL